LAAEKSHYFDPAPVVESKPRTVHLHVGELALEGIDSHAGTRAQVVFQNEFLSFERGGAASGAVAAGVVSGAVVGGVAGCPACRAAAGCTRHTVRTRLRSTRREADMSGA